MAVPLTLLATIVQLVLVQGCWQDGALRWRVLDARVCREEGARVTTNVMVRDKRRLEVIADGLSLHGGAQLAIDTTIVSALHCDGTPHIGAANVDGLRLAAARRRKERNLSGVRSRHGVAVVWLS